MSQLKHIAWFSDISTNQNCVQPWTKLMFIFLIDIWKKMNSHMVTIGYSKCVQILSSLSEKSHQSVTSFDQYAVCHGVALDNNDETTSHWHGVMYVCKRHSSCLSWCLFICYNTYPKCVQTCLQRSAMGNDKSGLCWQAAFVQNVWNYLSDFQGTH